MHKHQSVKVFTLGITVDETDSGDLADFNMTEPDKSPKVDPSPADHVQTLSQVGESIPKLLESAGSAISLLTNSASVAGSSVAVTDDQRKEQFQAHVRKYFTTLRHVQETLLKQTDALEDAGIIPIETAKPSITATTIGQKGAGMPLTVAEGNITNGGMGKMDVSWLNSLGKDVGREKEKDVVKEAKEWLVSQNASEEIKDEIMKDG
jgi:Mediator complex protein